ncbi:MAG: anion transporter [Elusimicrobia bacterium]|nr:anion transporter [Elusimicrobiota bacterium]
MAWAVAVFVLTYLLISFQNIPGVHIHRPAAALVGATAMVVLGVVRLDQAYRLVDMDTLAFILGMMVLIGYLELSGFFQRVESAVLARARTPRQLLALVVASSGLLSALFMNDTVCLMLTPLVLRVTRRAGLSPNAYLVALATAANIGSAMTPMGNPQNMIVAVHSRIPFLPFVLTLAPLALAGLALDYWAVGLAYAGDLSAAELPPAPAAAEAPGDERLLAVCLGATVLLLALFMLGVPPPLAALASACAVIVLGATRPRAAFRHVDWELLLMFAGLFVVMGGLRASGALERLFAAAASFAGRSLPARLAAVSAASAVGSNVVSNVPCVVFLVQLLPGLGGGRALWLALAWASTVAGNLTLIGSVANLIVLETSKGETRVGFWEYCRVGAPVALLLIAAGTGYLALVG